MRKYFILFSFITITSNVFAQYSGGAYDGYGSASTGVLNAFQFENAFAATCPSNTLNIAWSVAGYSQIDLLVSIDGGTNYTLLASGVTSSNGSYDWVIPGDAEESATYKIKMQATAALQIFVESTSFEIRTLSASLGGVAATYYEQNEAVTLLGIPSGGTYSGNGVTGNSFDPNEAGIGTHTLEYNYASNGCVAPTASVTVDVIADDAIAREAFYQGGTLDAYSSSATGVLNAFNFDNPIASTCPGSTVTINWSVGGYTKLIYIILLMEALTIPLFLIF